MMFQSNFLFFLVSLAIVAGQQEDEFAGTLVREDFFPPENSDEQQQQQYHLRRQTQQATCRAMFFGVDTNSNCVGTYPCGCNGVPTDCPYCTTASASGVVCQQAGQTSTFVGQDGGLQTCSCIYSGSGAAISTCRSQTPSPAAVLSPPPNPTPMPTPANRNPGNFNANPPTPDVGVSDPPAAPLVGLGCTAFWGYNPRLCIGSPEECSGISCSRLMSQHPCVCQGSLDTHCSYCQVQTASELLCQVVGSSLQITAPDGVQKTCTCDYAGSGQTVQSCTPTASRTFSLTAMP